MGEDFLEESVDLGLTFTGKRTRALFGAGWSQRTGEVSGDQEDTLDFSFRINRRLMAHISADFSLLWQKDSGAAGDDEDVFFASFALNRALGRHSSIGVGVGRRDEDLGGSDSSIENRLGIHFTTSLL